MGEKKHILSLLVENHYGVLSRIAGLFSRRGFNIDSLSVAETENPRYSRMTIATVADDNIFEQIIKQVDKLVDVKEVVELKSSHAVMREHVLIRVKTTAQTRGSIIEIANIFRGNIVDVATDALVVELTGDPKKITAFMDLMKEYGILEIVRTGLTALSRTNK